MGASGAPAEHAPRRPETEELRDRALQEAALAGDGGRTAGILLHDRLEERGVGEVAEDQVIEARPQVGELARLPRPGQDGEPLRVERPQETPERVAEIAVVVETGALDQAREVRMLFQIVEEAVEDGVHHRRLEAPALAPGPALAALRDQRNDRRDAQGEDRLVQRPFVAEVMVEARLVLEPRLGGYFPHRYAGEAALGEAPLGGVEDGVARRGGFAAAGRGHPGAHALRVHEQTFVCQGEDAAGRGARNARRRWRGASDQGFDESLAAYDFERVGWKFDCLLADGTPADTCLTLGPVVAATDPAVPGSQEWLANQSPPPLTPREIKAR